MSDKISAPSSAYDFYCPVCKADKFVMCKEKGYAGEKIPHASRVQLAEHANNERARKLREQLKRNMTSGFRTRPTPRSVEEIVGRLLDVLERGDWPMGDVHTLAVWNRRTDLFRPGDPALLSYTNGGGTRCGMIAWSSKKKAVIGPRYAKFSASYYDRKKAAQTGRALTDVRKNFDIVAHVFDCKWSQKDEKLVDQEMAKMMQFEEREERADDESRQRVPPVFRAAVIQRFERHGRTYTASR